MRYGELVQFEPIETVVQLQEADEEATARRLVETYVISDRMAEQLAEVVIPQLQFMTPRDNKGVLVVGNYGTGKSHLMSVVSAVAEYPGLAANLTHPRVREAAGEIAGRFKVARIEIGAVQRGLRDILLDELEQALARWGTPFTFPPADTLTNHKDVLVEAVAAFQERYPDQGILLVVDELLDYLRGREERALILDLGFLRELGEVAALTSFRFVGGLQETLFDSPRFAFVAEPLRRVRDRFEQVRIAREDIAFVVANRLLAKSDEQLARITEHLRPFTPLYARMAERLEEFARLFPIHPAYLETFEQVHVAEKREVLRTLSRAMKGLFEQEVPTDRPALVAYDHYWNLLRGNPGMRGLPGVAEVIEKSGVLEGRIENAYTRPALRPMALRIVHGLSVLRLTTDDVHAPLGATPEELRDNLCLWTQMPEQTAEFLLGQVRVALREILRTVSGQYISYNEANDQYYLDVRKDIDFEAKVRERGEAQDRTDLNRFFFDGLQQVLGLSDTTYLTGTRLWLYELPWAKRTVTRPGYLFFRPPDERTTAQPPRDFLLYVLPPFAERSWEGETQADEVVFRLAGVGQDFEDLVRRYAGARATANDSVSHRDVYNRMADEALRRLRQWLNDYLHDHLQVTYRGVTEPVGQALTGARSSASRDLAELMQNVAAAKLAPLFAESYPDYPAFDRLSQPVTEQARPGTAAEAIRVLAGRARTNQGTAVLEALGLVDDEGTIRPGGSPYARHFLNLLWAKPAGQVMNRGEIIERVAGGIAEPIEKDFRFRMEPEWVAVVLTALVYAGEIALSLDGREVLEAATIERAATIDVKELTDFRFYKEPRSLPIGLWGEIFETLGVQPALVRDETTREQGVRELQLAVQRELRRTVGLQTRLAQGVRLWNTPVFTDNLTLAGEKGAVVGSDLPEGAVTSVAAQAGLRGYKGFLERLQRYTTVGRLRNLDLSDSQVGEARRHRKVSDRLENLLELVDRLAPTAAYLAEAQANLPPEHPWSERAGAVRDRVLAEVRRGWKGDAAGAGALVPELEGLKREYVAAYAAEHERLTLGPKADDWRARLTQDPRLAALRALSAVDLLDKNRLARWQQALTNLPTCRQFYEGIIAETPTCPNCHLRPSQRQRGAAAEQTLRDLDDRLDALLAGWRRALRDALGSEAARESIGNMTAAERTPIEAFLSQSDDEVEVPAGFAQAATDALQGIQTVTLWPGDLLEALARGGLPCTREELRSRFDAFLEGEMRGKERRTTRLTLGEREMALAAD